MAKFVKGDVVVVPFPFSDLTEVKRRPALVVAPLDGEDVLLCQITSKAFSDNYSISLIESDFQSGSLKQVSNIRPNRLFTSDSHLILYRIGNLSPEKVKEVANKIVEIVTA